MRSLSFLFSGMWSHWRGEPREWYDHICILKEIGGVESKSRNLPGGSGISTRSRNHVLPVPPASPPCTIINTTSWCFTEALPAASEELGSPYSPRSCHYTTAWTPSASLFILWGLLEMVSPPNHLSLPGPSLFQRPGLGNLKAALKIAGGEEGVSHWQ